MIKTKLIIVEGISGSGKSTTAHYIARQLEKNEIKVKCFFEEQNNNPFNKFLNNQRKNENDVQFLKRQMAEFVKQWKRFVKKIKDEDTIHIIESKFFKDILIWPVYNDLDKKITKEFSHEIYKAVKPTAPVLIHFYQEDVGKALRTIWKKRGAEWTNQTISDFDNSPFCKRRKLKGKKASIEFMTELTNITKELYNEFDMKKILIENSKQEWSSYREEILNLLEVEQKEEILYKNSFDQYCDDYLGKGYTYKVHKKDGRLCIDARWFDEKLIQVSDSEFEIEGLPITFKFYKYKGVKKVKILKSDYALKEGEIADKYIPVKIDKSILEKYCGTYWCEKDKLERKIILKDGILIYEREKGVEFHLITISRTEFMIFAWVENKIEFKKVKGEWQFTYDMKGKNPSHSLFVRKSEIKK